MHEKKHWNCVLFKTDKTFHLPSAITLKEKRFLERVLIKLCLASKGLLIFN